VGSTPSCSETGVLGAAAGVMGTLQALEILKEIAGAGESMAGRLLIYEALETRFRSIAVRPDPACRLCGPNPSIRGRQA
jgi:adenylyltransferase/sulfurtransferase